MKKKNNNRIRTGAQFGVYNCIQQQESVIAILLTKRKTSRRTEKKSMYS